MVSSAIPQQIVGNVDHGMTAQEQALRELYAASSGGSVRVNGHDLSTEAGKQAVEF